MKKDNKIIAPVLADKEGNLYYSAEFVKELTIDLRNEISYLTRKNQELIYKLRLLEKEDLF